AQNDASSSSPLSRYCSSACDRVNACDDKNDLQACKDGCTNDHAAMFPKFRADFVQQAETCVANAECKTVVQADLASECLRDAPLSLKPSDEGMHLCDDLAALSACVTIDRLECTLLVTDFVDDALREADACTQKTCSQFNDCFAAALGGVTLSRSPS